MPAFSGQIFFSKKVRTVRKKFINGIILVVVLLSNGSGVATANAEQGYSGQQINAFEFPATMEKAQIESSPVNSGLLQTSCQISGDLLIANGETCSLIAGSYTFNTVTIQAGGTLVLISDSSSGLGVTVTTTTMVVEATGMITSDGQGYPRNAGPGAGSNGSQAAGGGHGGQGGRGSGTSVGGVAYGNVYEPITLGSGGGTGGNNSLGGPGGGSIRLIVNDTLSLNGTISSNGLNGSAHFGAGGGGAGGSIWITTSVLTGSGQIRANGGIAANSYGHAGGGGGGRIAINVPETSNSFSGIVTAYGNSGLQYGGPGTIYWTATDHLVIDNDANQGAAAGLITGVYHFNYIDIKRKGTLRILGSSSALTLEASTLDGSDGTGRLEAEGTIYAPSNFIITKTMIAIMNEISGVTEITTQDGGGLELHANSLSHPGGVYSFQSITLKANTILRMVPFKDTQNAYGVTLQMDDLMVETNSTIISDGLGYGSATGPGAGPNGAQAAGGGHGSQGGRGSGTSVGGIAYGNLYEPTTLGSGGGNGQNQGTGGAGGGTIRLIVNDTLTLDGTITSNGLNGNAYFGAGGGGAGGSIWITAHEFIGNGQIRANGGNGADSYGQAGGGAGGRIAIYTNNLADTIQFSAQGGTGYENGGDGTIYLDAIDPSKSTVVITPDTGVADGVDATTVTVTLKNAYESPIPNRLVEIAVSSGFGLNINTQMVGTNEFVAIGNTDENGQVTATLTTTKSGTRYIKAKADQESIEQNGSVEFIPGPVSITLSRIDTGTAPIPADGSTPGNITVTIFDANNNPIPDITVDLQSTGSAVITPSSVSTNSLGMAFVQIFDSVPESVIVSAAVDGAGLTDTAELVFKGADLSVSMTAPSEAPGGRETHYFYKVGVSADYLPTPDTTLVVTLPAGITYVDDTSTVAVVQNGQTLSWDFDTLNPGETLSFTLIGEISSSLPVGASLSTTAVVGTSLTEETLINNSATVITTLISGFSFTGSVSPINQTLGIGATGNYEIIIENTGLLADTYDISITGIDPQQYTLSPAETTLTPGETGKVALSVYANSCEEGGSHPFVATITSRSENMSLPLAATAVFQSEPVLSSLRPGNESVIGSRDVTVSWNTDTVATGVLTVYPLGEPQKAQGYQTPAGTMHLVVVPGLSRQTTYEWYVTAVSPCGTVTSATRQFTVGNGVVFQKHQQSLTINRDYDQTAQIWVTNQDSRTHEVFIEIQETYDDLTVNFRGSGSIDGSITLLPGESRAVELAVFAQDVAFHDYTLSAVLTSSDGEDTFNDFATINIHVLFDVEYTFEVVSSNPVLNIKTYRITNLGQPITDLYVRAVGRGTDLPAPVYISPQIVHARLGTGESIDFNVLPLYSNDDLADASGELSPLKVLASLEKADIFDGSFDLISEVAGVVQRHQAQQTCDGGRSVYPVTLSNVMMQFSFRSWYCPNRENIYMGLCIPPFVRSDNITGANLRLGIDPTAKPEPYNFSLNLNGNSVATINNQILDGEYMFPVNPAHIKTGFGPCTKNVIHIHADFPNYAHYKVWANGTLWLALDSATVYICASSQAEANQLAQEMYGFVELPEYFDINIQKPATYGTVQPEADGSINLQAFVSDSASTYTNFYQVEAEVEYLDVLLTPKENILLYDDGASVHGDSASDDRYFNALWQPKYGGQVHMTVTATGPDGRVATDEMTFTIEALPDLAINKVFIEEVSLLNTNARVRAEITNLGFTVSGPVNVDFIYYATDENGNKVGDPIHTSHLQILTGQPGQPVILTRGSSVEIEDTEFTPNALALYFVEVIVDP